MAVKRKQNWLGQQRVDIPHLRAVESAICADFDLVAGTIIATREPIIVSGFYVVTNGVTQATALQIQVADSVLMHYNASESGSIFQVPSDRPNEVLNSTNPRVSGSFLPSQVNYVGVDFTRSADPTTTDNVEFIEPNQLIETGKSVPLARTLDYTISISATDFDSTPGICPIAKVTTDSTGHVVSVEDARNIFGRLGSGGATPNPLNAYSWPAGRKEGSSGDPFLGGDKAIIGLKAWMDAVMTRVWELGGGEYWYSSAEDRNVVLARTGSAFTSSGEYFEWSGTNLHWKGLTVVFTNSSGISNAIADQATDSPGLTDLADGECIYVDLDRTQNRSGGTALHAVKATLALLGTPAVPGARWVLAWRYGSSIFTRDQSYAVGSAFKLATTAAAGMAKLSATDSASVTPARVATVDSVSFLAYAAGLTRGNDFVGGAGDLQIGSGTTDHNVLLTTTRNQDEVVVTGTKNYGITPYGAPLTVQNGHTITGIGSNQDNLVARFRGYNGSASRYETAFTFAAEGVLGFRSTHYSTPNAPSPIASDPIDVKLYFRKNGLSSPDSRQQMVILWADGNETVLAESEAS
jgi:hypothetical protein